jgi:hypothetical protein
MTKDDWDATVEGARIVRSLVPKVCLCGGELVPDGGGTVFLEAGPARRYGLKCWKCGMESTADVPLPEISPLARMWKAWSDEDKKRAVALCFPPEAEA